MQTNPVKDMYKAFLFGILGGGFFTIILICWFPSVNLLPLATAENSVKPAVAVQPQKLPDLPQETEDPMTPREEKAALKASRTIDAANREGLQDASEAATVQAKAFFSYKPTGIYQIYCHEGHLTDIQLQPGEDILYIGGGDTTRWIVDRAQSGTSDSKQWHVYIKPMKSNIATNFMIATDKRSYQIRARSGTVYNPIIGWTYPLDEKAAFLRQQTEKKQKEEEQISSTVSPEKMNFNYKVEEKSGFFGGSFSWTPKMVFDDGIKTYIQMADTMPSGEAPALFVSDGKEVTLVNYRVKKNYYIVDRLFAQAEMRNGLKEVVVIKKVNNQ